MRIRACVDQASDYDFTCRNHRHHRIVLQDYRRISMTIPLYDSPHGRKGACRLGLTLVLNAAEFMAAFTRSVKISWEREHPHRDMAALWTAAHRRRRWGLARYAIGPRRGRPRADPPGCDKMRRLIRADSKAVPIQRVSALSKARQGLAACSRIVRIATSRSRT